MRKGIRSLSFAIASLFTITAFLLSAPSTASAEQFQKTRQPQDLHPVVAEHAELLRQHAAARGINIRFTDGFRSFEEQDRLYAQGRTTAGYIVTNAQAGESYHNYGLAIDFALEVGHDVIWDLEYDGNGNGYSDWFEVAQIAKNLGFTWGGDWESFKDYPHLQMDFGYSIHNLINGNHYLF
ncbi:M15 family metallopeptidase [Salinicoccus sp. CNSTN-B1]